MGEGRKLAAILAADVVGYSRLAGADEERILARLRALRSDLIDPAVAVHNGRVVKRTGDGAIVEFRSAVDAVRCALEIQTGLAERNAGVPAERRIEFRIGVHVGDVVEESDGDLMGDGVNIAARLEGVAKPGAICLSEDAYRHVKARLDHPVIDLGATHLKNIAEPMRVYALAAGEPATATAAKATPLARPVTPERPSIAVLPFANMSGDAEQDYFADGISEDIITALAKLPQLFVVARNSTFTFKGRNVLVAEVGKSLGVRYVVEGSVRKSGGRVRITAQLIEAATGGHLWAEKYDRELTDIFGVQDDVTAKIVSELAVNLSVRERRTIAAENTQNPEVYDCFLRGRELWWRHTRDAAREARTLLERATRLDPGFAPAHAFLAMIYGMEWGNVWSKSPERSREDCERAARRAMELDPGYPYAPWALAHVLLWFHRRQDEALATLEAAIAANPNFADGFNAKGIVLHYIGRNEAALASFAQADALDPASPDVWLYYRAQALYQLGRWAEAAALLERRIALNPETDISRVLLAACYGQMGRSEDARETWDAALRANPAYSFRERLKTLPYKNPGDADRVGDGLRKAGVEV